MSIQEELHNIRNAKTLKDYNELFNKISTIVQEEIGTDLLTFLKSRQRLGDTVHSKTLTEWSYRSK
jgi:hypothetical protein